MAILKEQSAGLTTERKLQDFDWRLAMPVARSAAECTKQGELMPNARAAIAELDFGAAGESVAVQLTKTQLQGLYEELEKAQMKVDELMK